MIRVLVFDDSAVARERAQLDLEASPDLTVCGTASDGNEGVAATLRLRPDVVVMDLNMPDLDGYAATRAIMEKHPVPVIVLTSENGDDASRRAFESGAVEFVSKGTPAAKLVEIVRLVAKVKVVGFHVRERHSGRSPSVPPPPPNRAEPGGAGLSRESIPKGLVAVGASTGGPGALVDILRGLPAEFSLPLVFVLHISPVFGPSFADWLDAQTERRVAFARDGEPIASAAGRVVMAPAERHLVVRDGCFRLTRDPERHSCRPSVDVLFESMARELGGSSAACLLTGMGRDGAAGLLQIRRAGGLTIAQDEATSIVYGMPREAVQLGAAVRVLPLGEIAPTIAALDVRAREKGR